jgi:putative endonuclease
MGLPLACPFLLATLDPMSKASRQSKRGRKGRWCVYLLRCADGSLYCGMTNELKTRVATHNTGRGAKYTRSRLPVKLAYGEAVKTRSMALRREYQIKKLSKKSKEALCRQWYRDNMHL